MAQLKPIEYPKHLNEHTLTEQELVNLSPSQQALAKDWNVINRKMDWLIDRVVDVNNTIVNHDNMIPKIQTCENLINEVKTTLKSQDDVVETMKKSIWLIKVVFGGGGALAALFLIYRMTTGQ